MHGELAQDSCCQMQLTTHGYIEITIYGYSLSVYGNNTNIIYSADTLPKYVSKPPINQQAILNIGEFYYAGSVAKSLVTQPHFAASQYP